MDGRPQNGLVQRPEIQVLSFRRPSSSHHIVNGMNIPEAGRGWMESPPAGEFVSAGQNGQPLGPRRKGPLYRDGED